MRGELFERERVMTALCSGGCWVSSRQQKGVVEDLQVRTKEIPKIFW